jgi:hypothetical protein
LKAVKPESKPCRSAAISISPPPPSACAWPGKCPIRCASLCLWTSRRPGCGWPIRRIRISISISCTKRRRLSAAPARISSTPAARTRHRQRCISGKLCRLSRKPDRHSRYGSIPYRRGGWWVPVLLSPAQEFEGYARECVRLAALATDPPIVEQLLEMAREWMNAALEAESGSIATPPSPPASGVSRVHR